MTIAVSVISHVVDMCCLPRPSERTTIDSFTSQPYSQLIYTMQIEDIREKFGRFRILVIGRANAGKTTILKSICQSTENPKIHDENGKEV